MSEEKCNVRIKFLRENILEPTKASPGSSCYDAYLPEDMKIYSGVTKIPLGFSLEIPPGFECQVRSRSGLASRGIIVANQPGTIDSDYRGEVAVLLTTVERAAVGHQLKAGDRICQLAFQRVPEITLEVVEELTETARGAGGFGSSGV